MSVFMLAALAVLLVVYVAPALRIVWIRRQLRGLRHTLMSVHGYSDGEEMHAELREVAVRLSPKLGRFVRVNNLAKTRV
jgi:hypothetical protein